LFFIPAAWVLLEYLRSHLLTGFPWALLGYSQQPNLPIIQIADITGAWGVSFVVMAVNVMIYAFCVMRHALGVKAEKQRKKLIILLTVLLFVSLGYGFYRLGPTQDARRTTHNAQRITHSAQRTTLKVSVLQPNIPQELKWDESARDYIIKKYLGLTAVAAGAKPDLLIWPEAALPVVLEEEPAYYRLLVEGVKRFDIPLFFGAVTQRRGLYYNSACLISSGGELLSRYDKIHLVPFGEYIPLKKALPFLETIVPIGDITPGEEYTVFNIDSLASWPVSQLAGSNRQTGKPANRQTKFSVLICFEDLFPALSRRFVREGADFLVNITNDAWYKKTSAAAQHFQASVFRAVENRVYLVRAANTGISGFISPLGKAVALVRDQSGNTIFVEGIATQSISLEKPPVTIYNRAGDYFILLLFLLAVYSGPFRPKGA
jgi:apolipoprotein N-acyltransferase